MTAKISSKSGNNEQEIKIKEYIIDSAISGIVMVNMNGILTYINQSILTMWGYERAQDVLGNPNSFLWRNKKACKEAFQNMKKGHWQGELVAKRKDNSIFYAQVMGTRITNAKGKPIYVVGHILDISEKKKITNDIEKYRKDFSELLLKQKALSQRLVEAQERERKSIGEALHDQLGGTLAMLLMNIKQAKKMHSKNSITAFSDIEKIVNDAYQELRRLSHSLRPSILDDFGLFDALAWYIERFEERTGIEVNFNHKDGADVDLLPTIATVVYRIVQEALTNILKHAKTTAINVSISIKRGRLILNVEDFGCGFDLGKISPEGSGIVGMQDLCEFLNGKLVIDSSLGLGTRISCIFPLQENKYLS